MKKTEKKSTQDLKEDLKTAKNLDELEKRKWQEYNKTQKTTYQKDSMSPSLVNMEHMAKSKKS